LVDFKKLAEHQVEASRRREGFVRLTEGCKVDDLNNVDGFERKMKDARKRDGKGRKKSEKKERTLRTYYYGTHGTARRRLVRTRRGSHKKEEGSGA
jgi:hypothetical protein